jgi:4-amino-4-deoxy-L-arabinose transferase-like glycosyltransferase
VPAETVTTPRLPSAGFVVHDPVRVSNDQLPIRAILPLFAAIATVSIFLHGPLPMFGTRTLAVAWEMWHAGSWLVPLQNGEPYSHKAPLLYWLIHLGWWVGGVGETWPKLLMVVIAVANLVLAGRLARQLFPELPDAASLAAWVLAGTVFWFLYALQFLFDGLLTACVLLALVGLTRRRADGAMRPDGRLLVLGLWLGLLAKGPVALLHVAFPLLLAPWWLEAARASRARWYARVAGWVALALGLFAAWVVPVAILGGEAYRQELLVTQTAGRVVAAFDHAEPVWWYLAILPIVLLPWSAWPGTWRGLATPGQASASGFRFLGLWLVPTLIAFSAISGKQAYYILPQLAGFAIWLAAVTLTRAAAGPTRPAPRLAAVPWVLVGLLVAALPWLTASGRIAGPVPAEFAGFGPWIGLAIVGIAMATGIGARDAVAAVPRLALAALAAAALLHVQFTATLWPRYDLAPVAAVLAEHERAGGTIANRGTYEAQFHFLGRLTRPIVELDYHTGPAFAEANPDAIVVDYVDAARCPDAREAPAPILCRPFRGERLELWRAADWLAGGQAGGPPAGP